VGKHEHENKTEEAPGFSDLEAYCLRCGEADEPLERAQKESHVAHSDHNWDDQGAVRLSKYERSYNGGVKQRNCFGLHKKADW